MANIDGTNDTDFLEGTDAPDVIHAFGGQDFIQSSAGADFIDGGTGSDRVEYDNSNAGVTVLLGDGLVDNGAGGFAAGDVLRSIENVTGSAFDDTIFGDGADNFIDGFGGADVLKGGGGDDDLRGSGTLEGGSGDDSLRGGFGADTLRGDADNDRLDGREGADLLDGGAGVDTVVYEASDAGVTIILADDAVDNGAGGDAAGDRLRGIENVSGSSFADQIFGDGVANRLSGQDGDDILKGGGGADVLLGEFGADTLEGGDGNDRLIGGFGADRLVGDAGVDTADYSDSFAGVSVDLLAAGSGGDAAGDTYLGVENIDGSEFDDALTGNAVANTLFGGQGEDTLKGGGGSDLLFGSFDDDNLFGGDGDDVLSGGEGADVMAGGAGNDTYVFDNNGDTIDELIFAGSGIDTVQSRTSFSLLGSQVQGAVENVTLTGTANVNATGNMLANVLRGNDGANRLSGGTGADTMIGGKGSDRYTVDNAGDVVDESGVGVGGVEEVGTTISLSLSGPQVKGTVENLLLLGQGSINGAGNAVANEMVGNGAANDLMGLGGNDTLRGGGGADDFVFNAALNAATNVDRITDFNVLQDTMRLENAFMTALGTGQLKAAAFRIGAAAGDASDRIIYNDDNGTLSYDRDGTGSAAQIRFAILEDDLAMSNTDFFVV